MADLNRYYADSCERCLVDTSRSRSAPAPVMGVVNGDGLLAAYCCPICGHLWTCAWGLVPGRVMPPPPGPGGHPLLAALLAEQAAVNRARFLLGRRDGDAA